MVKVEDYEVPENLYYHKEYLWARVDDGKVKIGMIDFAQKQLHDIVYVELPGVGDTITQNEPFGTLESVKAVSDLVAPVSGTIEAVKTVSDLYMPVDGEVVEVNPALEDTPELVNSQPFDEGWMIRIKMSDPAQLEDLIPAEQYRTLIS